MPTLRHRLSVTEHGLGRLPWSGRTPATIAGGRAWVAQPAEQRTRNAQVRGSSPLPGSIEGPVKPRPTDAGSRGGSGWLRLFLLVLLLPGIEGFLHGADERAAGNTE